ncbi:MAG: hypothetical protein FJ303_05165 [Planctomycetes bacterium]|nr:hypothetical protein [Planctomycetota bacterium]
MRKWFVSLSLACGTLVLANVAVAQVQDLPAPAQPQVQKIQVQVQGAPPVQVQILPAVNARADIAIMPGGPRLGGGSRMAQADAIFVGRVIAIEPMDVEATQVANGPKVTYRVAVVQVSDAIFGLKPETKQVRIGFVVQNGGPNVPPGGGIQILPAPAPGQPAIQPLPGRRVFPGYMPQIQLAVGQDGMFTVNKHHKENFYLSPNYQGFVASQNNPGFEGQVKTAKQIARVLTDPVKALRSDDRQDRYTAAAVLITKYRMPDNPTGRPMKLEAVDAEESKLILKALAEGDWKQGAVFGNAIPSPFELFNQLGVSPKDGYNPINVRTQADIFTAMQKWLDENQGKYRVQRLVADPNAKGGIIQPGVIEPGPVPVPVPNPINPRPGIRPVPPVKIQPLPAPAPVPVPPQRDIDVVPPQPVPAVPARPER